MKRLALGLLALLAGLAVALSIIAARFQPTIRRNTVVGIVPVGGLTQEEAAKKLRIWWEAEKRHPLKLVSPLVPEGLPEMTAGQLGIGLDDVASVQTLPMSDLISAASSTVVPTQDAGVKFPLKFKHLDVKQDKLADLVAKKVGKPRPAKVELVDGQVVRHPEISGYELKEDKLPNAVVAALEGDGKVVLPIDEAPKTVPDEELNKIVGVASEFSTHFPASQTNRNQNLRLASEKLNGVVLMPGQQMSFNETVGRRTVKGGFREAPVLKNGKHDKGIGGGICQVSTTLYNASLLADLKIVHRENHSIPSAYVPVGRDATVDWGNLDLVIENNQDMPVAISSSFEPGKLTFRILGKPDPSMKVDIVTGNHKSWDRGMETVTDPHARPGYRKVVEKGSRGHSITTYRVVYRDGVQVKREVLNHSYYKGTPRLIVVGPSAKKAVAKPPTAPKVDPSMTTPRPTTSGG